MERGTKTDLPPPVNKLQLQRPNLDCGGRNHGTYLPSRLLGHQGCLHKTKRFASLLAAVGADRGCLLALHEPDVNVWKSARNIPKTEVCDVEQLNAYEILRRKKLMLTMPAFKAMVEGEAASKLTVDAQGESST